MNFYEHVWNQQLHNQSIMVNYITGYIYFMKTWEENIEDHTWLKHYINLTEIN